MRYMKLTLLIFGLAATLCAADPFAGTWKLNLAKSKYKAGPAPKEVTVTISESGTEMTIKVMGTAADASSFNYSYTLPSAGGTGKITGTPAYDGVSSKRVTPTEREVNFSKGGKTVYSTHSKLSADGNSMSLSAKGVNAQGKPVEADAVYEKQK